MKRFQLLINGVVLAILMFLTPCVTAQNKLVVDTVSEPITLSLLTCGPGNEVYSLYGHTAIRVQIPSSNEDFVVNYGMFSFRQPYFVLRFIFGLTDYEMGIYDYNTFVEEYRLSNRWVKEQVLDLNDSSKRRILQAIFTNYEPQNRTYRYNYFYDNCSTRARDILLNNTVTERVVYLGEKKNVESFRQLIHRFNKQYPWARWGNDVLLGVGADRVADRYEQDFLPENLMAHFSHAVVHSGGQRRPLVSETRWVISPSEITTASTSGYTKGPVVIAWILLLHACIFTVIELFVKKTFKLFDTLLCLQAGLAGMILLIMVFSAHPTVRLNLQILLLNPLALLGGFLLWKKFSFTFQKRYWCIMVGALLLFFLGNMVQQYAEGMNILALCLLMRYVKKLYELHRKEQR